MADGSFNLQKAVYDLLSAVSPPLADGGIHAVAPQDQALPYIEIGETSSTQFDVQCRTGTDEFLTIHVWTHMGSYEQVKEIMSNISDILHQTSIIVSGRSAALATVNSRQAFADADENAIHGIIILRVVHWSNAA